MLSWAARGRIATPAETATPAQATEAPQTAALHPLTLRFREPELEAAFRADHFRNTGHQIRIALWVLAAFFLAVAVGNLPSVQAALGTPRFFGREMAELLTWYVWLVDLPLLVGLLALSYSRWFERLQQPAVWLAYVVIMAGIPLGILALPPDFPPYFILAVISFATFAAYTVLRLRFVYAASLGLAIFGLYGMAVIVRPGDLAAWQTLLNLGSLAFVNVFGMVASYQAEVNLRTGFYQRRLIERQHRDLVAERQRSEALLLNILPPAIAQRLKADERAIADGYGEVTVLFADIVGFTPLSGGLPPEQLVELLNGIFSRFDEATHKLGLEKIKTIGDAYMVAGGLPEPSGDHAERVARLALHMTGILDEAAGHLPAAAAAAELKLRIGMHCGPVVAGVIGTRKFSYDLWGDTVNVASRMESHGVPGAIHISAAVAERLGDRFELEPRGKVEIKGKGPMETWLLHGHKREGAA